jgi:uncharacterized protein YggU (UPF0235/DUF167 family)
LSLTSGGKSRSKSVKIDGAAAEISRLLASKLPTKD